MMRVHSARVASICLGVLLSAAPFAGPLDDVFPKKSGVCWGRVYDDSHLGKNPTQAVRALYMGVGVQGDNLERSAEDAAAAVDPELPRNVTAQIYVEPRSGEMIAGDVECSDTSASISCKAKLGVSGDNPATALRLQRVGMQLQVNTTAKQWPLLPFLDQISRPDPTLSSVVKIGADDRVFRLDRLPTARCVEIERRYAGALTDNNQPSILSRVKRAASSRDPKARALCLRSVDAPDGGGDKKPTLRLSLDTGKYDWPAEVDEFTFRVTQSISEARAVSSLSCKARTYAWRCEWHTTDDDREQRANRFANRILQGEETGLLLRNANGALLRGYSCLAGRCEGGAPIDIPLAWSEPSACEVAS